MKRIGILTSGGDASGMNAAVRATVRKGLSMGMEVYAIDRGFEGLLDGNIEKMQWHSVGDILQRGGTILRTARSERFRTEEGQERAVSVLDTFGIEGVVVIGGDGSFRGGMELSRRGVHVMGIPGTIDNDLAYTDYTIGFDTAVNTVLAMISNIRDIIGSRKNQYHRSYGASLWRYRSSRGACRWSGRYSDPGNRTGYQSCLQTDPAWTAVGQAPQHYHQGRGRAGQHG